MAKLLCKKWGFLYLKEGFWELKHEIMVLVCNFMGDRYLNLKMVIKIVSIGLIGAFKYFI